MSNSNKPGGRTIYAPFVGKDGSEHRYPLKKPSKKNIRQVCLVQSARISLGDRSRASYADQARLTPTDYVEQEIKDEAGQVIDTKRRPVFTLDDIYNEYYVHAALAQELFEGFPKLIEVVEPTEEDAPYTINEVDSDLLDALDEGEVTQAFFDFSEARNPTLKKLLKSFGT